MNSKNADTVKNLKVQYIAFCIFLISLQSFYFGGEGGGVSALCYLGLFLLIPFIFLNRIAWTLVLIPTLIIIYALIKTIFGDDAAKVGTAGMAFSSIAMIAIPAASLNNRFVLSRALSIVIWVHIFFIFVQILYFALTRTHLDILGMMGFENQRVFSRKGLKFAGMLIPRFAGLFNEPGTYSAIMVCLLVARHAVKRRMDFTTFVALGSIASTMSLGGISIGALFVAVVVATDAIKKDRILTTITAIGAMTLTIPWLRSLYSQRFLIDEGQIYHQYLWNWFWSQPMTLWGTSASQLQRGIVINDIGVWLYVIYSMGLVTAILMAAIIVCTVSVPGMLLLGVVLLTKVKLTYPMIFVCLGAIAMGYPTSYWGRSARRNGLTGHSIRPAPERSYDRA